MDLLYQRTARIIGEEGVRALKDATWLYLVPVE